MSDSDVDSGPVQSTSAETDSTPSGFEAKQAADDLELLEFTFQEFMLTELGSVRRQRGLRNLVGLIFTIATVSWVGVMVTSWDVIISRRGGELSEIIMEPTFWLAILCVLLLATLGVGPLRRAFKADDESRDALIDVFTVAERSLGVLSKPPEAGSETSRAPSDSDVPSEIPVHERRRRRKAKRFKEFLEESSLASGLIRPEQRLARLLPPAKEER
jgi:hypothetical protein